MDILKVKRTGYNINRWIDEDVVIRVISLYRRRLRYQHKVLTHWVHTQ